MKNKAILFFVITFFQFFYSCKDHNSDNNCNGMKMIEISSHEDPYLVKIENAIASGNETSINTLLEDGLNPNISFNDMPLISHSLMHKQYGTFYLLLKYGAIVNKDIFLEVLPYYCYKEEKVTKAHQMYNISKILIEKGADLNAENGLGLTPFLFSLQIGPDLSDLFISSGANIDGKECSSGSSALHYAAQDDSYYNIVEYLLKQDLDVDSVNEKNETPLHIASLYGNYNICRLLLNNNANTKIKSKFIITMDTRPSAKFCKSGTTPLHYAASKNDRRIIQLLIEHGASTEATDGENQTPLFIAIKTGNLNSFKALIENGANINAISKDNLTPLHVAVVYEQSEIVNMLLQLHAITNIKASIVTYTLNAPTHCEKENNILLCTPRELAMNMNSNEIENLFTNFQIKD